MNRDDIVSKLCEIFQEVLDNEKITIGLTDSSDTIDGWDSLAHILLISEIEDRFSVEIPMSEIKNMKKVSYIVDYLSGHTS